MDQRRKTMRRRQVLAKLWAWSSASGAAVTLTGCGTLLHSERIHQPHSRDLDWKMVALNGLGLIFFFVPGVIAFAVDFYTGALYLPPHPVAMKPAIADDASGRHATDVAGTSTEAGVGDGAAESRVTLRKVAVGAEALNVATIEQRVAAHVGHPVSLGDASTRVTKLETIEQFDQVHHRHQSDRRFGDAPKRFFQRLLPHLRLR